MIQFLLSTCDGPQGWDAVFCAEFFRIGFGDGCHLLVVRPWCTSSDSVFDPGQLHRLELARTLGGLASHSSHDRSHIPFAALPRAFPGAHVEATPDRLSVIPITGEALLLGKGPHAAHELAFSILCPEWGRGRERETCRFSDHSWATKPKGFHFPRIFSRLSATERVASTPKWRGILTRIN